MPADVTVVAERGDDQPKEEETARWTELLASTLEKLGTMSGEVSALKSIMEHQAVQTQQALAEAQEARRLAEEARRASAETEEDLEEMTEDLEEAEREAAEAERDQAPAESPSVDLTPDPVPPPEDLEEMTPEGETLEAEEIEETTSDPGETERRRPRRPLLL